MPLGSRDYGTGNVYEMRIYTYAAGDIPQVLEAWGKAIPDREKLSPLAACWTSELGGLNKFVHVWCYKDLAERTRIREESRKGGAVAAPVRRATDPPGEQAPDPGGLLAAAVGPFRCCPTAYVTPHAVRRHSSARGLSRSCAAPWASHEVEERIAALVLRGRGARAAPWSPRASGRRGTGADRRPDVLGARRALPDASPRSGGVDLAVDEDQPTTGSEPGSNRRSPPPAARASRAGGG